MLTLSRLRLEPSPSHPITIRASDGQVTVRAGSGILARSERALILHEHAYAPVAYFHRQDCAMERLEASEHHSWCPYKGEARYFHVRLEDGSLLENAAWTYETPFGSVEEIAGRLAFYPGKVEIVEA